jgi:hypothetical protein
LYLFNVIFSPPCITFITRSISSLLLVGRYPEAVIPTEQKEKRQEHPSPHTKKPSTTHGSETDQDIMNAKANSHTAKDSDVDDHAGGLNVAKPVLQEKHHHHHHPRSSDSSGKRHLSVLDEKEMEMEKAKNQLRMAPATDPSRTHHRLSHASDTTSSGKHDHHTHHHPAVGAGGNEKKEMEKKNRLRLAPAATTEPEMPSVDSTGLPRHHRRRHSTKDNRRIHRQHRDHDAQEQDDDGFYSSSESDTDHAPGAVRVIDPEWHSGSRPSRPVAEEEGGVLLGAQLTADREHDLNIRQQELDEVELALRHRIAGQEGEIGDVVVAVATEEPAQELDNHDGQHKRPLLLYFGCCLLALAAIGGVVAAAVILVNDSSSSSPSNIPTSLMPSQNEATESPTATDTSSPTKASIYDPPTPEDCLAIANGTALDGQDEMIARSFNIDMDIALDVGFNLNDTLLGDLEKRLQTVLAPVLTGCSDGSSSNYVVGNAYIVVESKDDQPCEVDSEEPCFHAVAVLLLYLQDEEKLLTLFGLISNVFGVHSLVDILGLSSPFKHVEITFVSSNDPTAAPSLSPSNAPTASVVPSRVPTEEPTLAPVTDNPTTSPPTSFQSKSPTVNPTPGPTPEASPGPTQTPTKAPTASPVTIPPTPNPTRTATNDPSVIPTNIPTRIPTQTPTMALSPSPTASPATIPPTSMPILPTESPVTMIPSYTASPSMPPSNTGSPSILPTNSASPSMTVLPSSTASLFRTTLPPTNTASPSAS